MIEFLNTLDPVLLSYYLLLAALAILATIVFAYFQAESSFEYGFNCGRSDLDSLIVKAENISNSKGYKEGKDAGIFMGKSHAQKVNEVTHKSTKTPVKQPANSSNTRRTSSSQNKPKPAAKKPVKKSVRGK